MSIATRKSLFARTILTAPAVAAICVALFAALALGGWIFHVDFLKRGLTGAAAMSPLTALCLGLGAASVWCSRSGTGGGGMKFLLGQGLAWLVLLLILANFTVTTCGLAFDLDHLFLPPETAVSRTAAAEPPSQMAPATAMGLLAAALALLLLDKKSGRDRRPAQYLAALVIFISWIALISYTYGTRHFSGLWAFQAMALPTGLALFFLGAGILCLRPDAGLMAAFTDIGAGSMMARRVLPVAIVTPIVLGTIRLLAERAGYFDTNLGAAMLVVSNIFIFALVIWWCSIRLNEIDRERNRAAKILRDSEKRFRAVWVDSADGFRLTDQNGIILEVNNAFCRMAGMSPEELVGQPISAMYHADENPPVHDRNYRERFRSGKIDHDTERRIKFRSGTVVDLEFSNSFIHQEHEDALLLAIFRDISLKKKAEEEQREFARRLEQQNHELQDALAKVKTLRGLLPICSGCKKIRDDKGYWNQIEFYIRDHSDANFTHGLCPECTRKYFPGYGDAI